MAIDPAPKETSISVLRISESTLATTGELWIIYRILQEIKIKVKNEATGKPEEVSYFTPVVGAKVEAWEQFSGFFVGNYTTDSNGLLKIKVFSFCWILQLRIKGSAFTEILNGVPGVAFPASFSSYYPLNFDLNDIISWKEIENSGSTWDEGRFFRPALKVAADRYFQFPIMDEFRAGMAFLFKVGATLAENATRTVLSFYYNDTSALIQIELVNLSGIYYLRVVDTDTKIPVELDSWNTIYIQFGGIELNTAPPSHNELTVYLAANGEEPVSGTPTVPKVPAPKILSTCKFQGNDDKYDEIYIFISGANWHSLYVQWDAAFQGAMSGSGSAPGMPSEPPGGGGGSCPPPSNSVVSETTFGQSSGAGSATSYSRGDHTHGTPAAPSGGADQIFNETPSGTINGSNKIFTTAYNFSANTTRVYRNGIRETLGIAYTETGTNQITFDDAPITGDIIRIDYQEALE